MLKCVSIMLFTDTLIKQFSVAAELMHINAGDYTLIHSNSAVNITWRLFRD